MKAKNNHAIKTKYRTYLSERERESDRMVQQHPIREKDFILFACTLFD